MILVYFLTASMVGPMTFVLIRSTNHQRRVPIALGVIGLFWRFNDCPPQNVA
jgi:hypothetical protein